MHTAPREASSLFTLIELMIVVAIIAVIAAAAIPSLIESKMQANEANAIAALKAYATAQTAYKEANYGATNGLAAKSYCPNFTRLGGTTAHIKASGARIDLISPVFAVATSSVNGYQGYYFTDAAGITSWQYDFGLYADPCVYDKSGVNTYFVDSKGMVMMKDMAGIPSGGSGYTSTDSTWTNP